MKVVILIIEDAPQASLNLTTLAYTAILNVYIVKTINKIVFNAITDI
jgi:hypothetical protein